MRWMMLSVALWVVVVPVAASAQKAKGDKKGKDSTYIGCIEAGSATGTVMLTHVAADPMAKDVGKRAAKGKKDKPVPTTVNLTSTALDLSKHEGHRVSVTGSVVDGKFTVKSLTMVASFLLLDVAGADVPAATQLHRGRHARESSRRRPARMRRAC
jgi:hypothetical protein